MKNIKSKLVCITLCAIILATMTVTATDLNYTKKNTDNIIDKNSSDSLRQYPVVIMIGKISDVDTGGPWSLGIRLHCRWVLAIEAQIPPVRLIINEDTAIAKGYIGWLGCSYICALVERL